MTALVGIARLALLLTLVAAFEASAQSVGSCTPRFPLEGGWLGADAAYSIVLPDGRDVWIFGDTLYGDCRAMEGTALRMVRNSIGISTCEDGRWSIEYVIRKSGTGKSLDFFQARTRRYWYWALDGFYHDGSLYVTLLCVKGNPDGSPEGLSFSTCGADLARISNLDANPQDWRVEYFSLVPDGVGAYPSASTVVEEPYVYLFALYQKGSRPLLLTRIPLEGLHEPDRHLQYFARNRSWKPGFKPEDAAPMFRHGPSELSVRYHEELGSWVAVFSDPRLSGAVLMRTAPKITGPWSEPTTLYEVPERDEAREGFDRDTVCYAGKEHPEFAETGSLLLTYTCNTTQQKLLTNLEIYLPKAIRVPLPEKD